jgi:hypothetical protein
VFDENGVQISHTFLRNVRMLSNQFQNDENNFPNRGFYKRSFWTHYHPGGVPISKPFTDFVSYADIYMTGVPI